MATSPTVMMLSRLCASAAVVKREPVDRAAPTTPRPFRKERRLKALPDGDELALGEVVVVGDS
jgi:hypothetical protein